MKITIVKISLLLILFSIISPGCTQKESQDQHQFESLAEGFASPPDSIQTSVYWYWISNNISKEGVVKDLEAMKKAGINRAFIGNIGLENVPYGEVEMLSEEWWEIIHLALKTATQLDIEIGIFNSPGWSQSGGPWVEAENAMRYLTASETTRVKGPRQFSGNLERPAELYQDVKVLAYPVPKYTGQHLNASNCTVTSQPMVQNLAKIMDGDTATSITFPEGKKFIIDFQSNKPFTARSISIRPARYPMYQKVLLQVQNQAGEFVDHLKFELDRANLALGVGFVPLAPLYQSLATVTSRKYRLTFSDEIHEEWNSGALNQKKGIAEIEISAEARLGNFAEKTFAKMHPTPLPARSDYQWDAQPEPEDPGTVIDPDDIIDLTSKLDEDGTLNWTVPEGEWTIIRMGMTPTGEKNSPASPEATGFEVDKMSKEHVEKHFYGHIGEILKRVPEEDRKTFRVVVQDSYEKGGQNFTDGFLQEFQTVYGYDPVPFLPAYHGKVVKSQQASDRFLWDVRRLVANKVAYDYVGGLREVSHEHGLTTWLENYGHWGFPGEFLMYGGQSDEIGGEFWSEGSLGNIENRAATSCGHIYGKSKISAESHTCGGRAFSRSPADLKQRGDRFFAEGINNTLLHVYIHQPYQDKNPGMNAWFGNPFNRKNTWFSQIDVFLDYIKRSNFMLQQGLNIADVAYFIGEDAPVMTGETNPPLPLGYQFDYMNAEVIMRDMTVQDGLLTLPHGTQYRMMVLPRVSTMRPELLEKIKQLVQDGGVILGPAPDRSPSLQNQSQADQQVAALAAELWGEVDGQKVKSGKFGQGIIMDGMTMNEALAHIDLLPDCKVPDDNSIHYGHRQSGNTDIYFISNQTDQEQIFNPEFRVKGRQPELWQATTGIQRALPAFEQKGNVTQVPMKLAPYESVFIVFNQPATNSPGGTLEDNFPAPDLVTELDGPWNVTFDNDLKGPEAPVVFQELIDWTASEDDRIRYYSGTADYEISFEIGELPQQHIVIDLGSVTSMAKVYLNGQYAGGAWTPPYTVDVTDYVRQGNNQLRVEVVNNWMNRLIGDQNLPEAERITWAPVNPYNAESDLQPSGLFGPVKVYQYEY